MNVNMPRDAVAMSPTVRLAALGGMEATLLPMGDGTHMVPIKAAFRKTLGKEHGDNVAVHLQQRLS